VGASWIERFISPERWVEFRERFVQFLDVPHSPSVENEILTRSGERRAVRWHNTALRAGSGAVIGSASIGEDITEGRRTQAALVESEAQTRNVPRGRVLKDEAVIDIASAAPRSAEALGRLRTIPAGFERSRTGADIVAAVERGLARDTSAVRMPERVRRSGGNGAIVELLKVLLKAVCEAEGVAPKIIATVDDLEAVADDDAAEVPALQGWRRTLFGEKALALKQGRLALSVESGRIVVRPLEAEPAAAGADVNG